MNSYYSTEIDEAIVAGKRAITALDRAESALSGARSFGIWDMFGGGFLSTMMKHGRMDDAQREIEQARACLRRFSREVADVSGVEALDIDVGGFLQFADYFFDGFVADWMVQSKIGKGRKQVQQAIHQVERIRNKLWSMLG